MNANHPKAPAPAAPFHKVAQNSYRLVSSGTYYALFKRSGKQIRKSLKTKDPAFAKRRLAELGAKVSRLSHTQRGGIVTFGESDKMIHSDIIAEIAMYSRLTHKWC